MQFKTPIRSILSNSAQKSKRRSRETAKRPFEVLNVEPYVALCQSHIRFFKFMNALCSFESRKRFQDSLYKNQLLKNRESGNLFVDDADQSDLHG